MFGPIGLPEFLVIAAIGLFCLLPIIAGIWGLVMLIRILSNQQSITSRLDALERRSPESSPRP